MDGPSVRLRLRVSAGARRPGVVGRLGDVWKVRVAAPPVAGKANAAVLELLAGALQVSQQDVEVVAGHRTRDKVVLLHGVTDDEVEASLALAAEPVP